MGTGTDLCKLLDLGNCKSKIGNCEMGCALVDGHSLFPNLHVF